MDLLCELLLVLFGVVLFDDWLLCLVELVSLLVDFVVVGLVLCCLWCSEWFVLVEVLVLGFGFDVVVF